MTNDDHNKYLGISFLVYAGFQMFMMLAMLLMMFVFLGSMPVEPGGPPPGIFAFMFLFMFVFQTIFTLPSVIAGYGLLKRKSWGRMAGIIGGVVSAMSFPVGTAVCVYAMWFLLGDNWKSIYEPGGSHIARGELPGPTDFERWQAEADAFQNQREKEPEPSDWR